VAGAGPRWPNLFLVGAAKAGTTTVYAGLARHPAIYMSPVKEPHYFSRIEPSAERRAFFPHVSNEAEYLALFDGAADQSLLGEASTSYLWDPHAAERIRRTSPEARILIIVRDPVERAYSQYFNDVREGLEQRPFMEALIDERRRGPGRWGVSSLYVDCGLYADQVRRYVDAFGALVHVSVFEELAADERRALAAIHAFLGLPPTAATSDAPAMNPAALPRNKLGGRLLGSGKARTLARRLVPRRVRSRARRALLKPATRPPMDPEARALLVDLYRSDVERLADLLSRPLPWAARW
jgi:Sulfotransferase family